MSALVIVAIALFGLVTIPVARRIREVRTRVIRGGFDFPFAQNPHWRPDAPSVHYPLLFALGFKRHPFTNIVLDESGIPQYSYDGYRSGQDVGLQANPMIAAWFGLRTLEDHPSDPRAAGRVIDLARWLMVRCRSGQGSALVWAMEFDWVEHGRRLTAPWPSAPAQGMVISLLTRAWLLSGDERFLEAACQGLPVFGLSLDRGGVRSRRRGGTLYEEYPLPSHILDGHLIALVGLLDVALAAEKAGRPADGAYARDRFEAGMDGLERNLDLWDAGRWSRYGLYGYLCSNLYHTLNRQLLASLGRAIDNPRLLDVAERWRADNLAAYEKSRIFMGLVFRYLWFDLCRRLGVRR